MTNFGRCRPFVILAMVAGVLFCSKKKTTNPGTTPTITPPVQLTIYGGESPAASSDGQWVAFREGSNLLKIKPDGSQLDTVFSGIGGDLDWSDWTRKGNLIVFGSVATIDANSGTIEAVRPNDNCFEHYPAWSPSGNEIAVTSRCPDRIVLLSYPGGDTSTVSCSDPDGSDCAGEGPTWSGDGNWLAFEDGLQILKVPKIGGTAQVVYDGYNPASSKDVTEPAWSPDGKWIAFVREDSTFTDSMFNFVRYVHIWVADARGASFGLWQVTTGPYEDFDPAWSFDSKFIYFTSNRTGQYDRQIWKAGFSF